MQSLIDEVNNLKHEIDQIKTILEFDTSKIESPSMRHAERRIGFSLARLIRTGPVSAIRPWLTSSKMQSQFMKQLGIGGSGMIAGFIGGMWSFGINAMLMGIQRLFRRPRSPQLEAREIQDIRDIGYHDLTTGFTRNLETEFIRGRGYRHMMRDEYFTSLSLERQIKRGVVGL